MSFDIPADLMVSVSGVRGRVGHGLTPEVAARFAAAHGAWIREQSDEVRPRVVLARDSRTSGPMYSHAVAAALQSVGCDVVVAGLVPTPTALLSVKHHGAGGAIIVTASHNPVEWNALKFASAAGMFLDAAESAAMRAYVDARPIPRAPWDGLGEVSADAEAAVRHVEAVLSIPFLDVAGLRRRRFRVALDCIRGAGSTVLPGLLRELGCEVVAIHTEPDGRFPRPPEPVAANLGELEALVRESGADIGLATDPDADRLSLVGNDGRALGEDFTLALAASLVLAHRPGPVATNLSTSRVLDDVCSTASAPLHRTPVGEIHVARGMQRVGAVIGGEGNGGVILPDVHHTRDSAVAAVLVLQRLLEAERPVTALVAEYPAYTILKESVPREAGEIDAGYERLLNRFEGARADRQDGLRLDWPERRQWLHFRASGTEPILRIIAEAPSAEAARALIAEARDAVVTSTAGT